VRDRSIMDSAWVSLWLPHQGPYSFWTSQAQTLRGYFSANGSHADTKPRSFAQDWRQSIVSVMLVEAVTEDEVSVPVMVSV
jgi:hypothetical protein